MVLMVVLLLWATPLCASLGERYAAENRWLQDVIGPFENDMFHDGYSPEEEDVDDSLQVKRESVLKHNNVITISMPGVKPQHMDTYMCVSKKLPPSTNYIVKYEPQAKMMVAHHMLLYGCDVPFKMPGNTWTCREMHPVCGWGGRQTLLYAWAKNAPSLTMPPNVGFSIGGNSGNKYLVLQVHYLHVAKFIGPGAISDHSGVRITYDDKYKRYLSGITVLAAGWPPIPAHKSQWHVNMGCTVTSGPTIYPFRFRTHAHKLGSVITAYRVRNNKWTIIGRGDPQRAQAFYTVQNNMDIQPNDVLIGRCTYNSMSRVRETNFGATHKDEMCNFYIMYYYDSKSGGNDFTCSGVDLSQYQYPKCNDVTLSDMEQKKCTDSAEHLVPGN